MNQAKYLMCKPTYFDIEYVINPWMNLSNKVNKEKAHKEWDNLYKLLKSLKVEVELIDPQPSLPDMTFSGDCGFVYKNKFLSSNFKWPQREQETIYYDEWIKNKGYEIIKIPSNIFFEGLGDVIYFNNKIIIGYGPRTDQKAFKIISDNFPELKIVGKLEIIDENFFHLALSVAFLDEKTIMYYPPALSNESQRFLQEKYDKIIPVSEQDAKEYFVCNNIPVGKTIIMDNCTPALENSLNNLGFEIKKCDVTEFKKSGGSVRCLVLKL